MREIGTENLPSRDIKSCYCRGLIIVKMAYELRIKPVLQGSVHIRLVLCYRIHIAVIGKQWGKRMQKMVPLLSLQVPPAASLLPSLCKQEQ